ncbi:MAG: family 16 glycoside hydrolase, partial [Phycisphaerae bacterium]
KDLNQWDVRPDAWKIQEDGSLYSPGKGGDAYSKEKFQDFTLDIGFKMSKGCNSGVFVRMADRKDWLHSSMEIQVLDSAGKPQVGRHDCGAVYDALAPSANPTKKAGEWNRFFITCFKNRVFVALNAVQIIDMDLNQWDTARKNPDGSKNKFRDPLKTLTHAGYFALQTHGKPVWFRSIRVRPLTALAKCPKCGREGPKGWYCAKCGTVCADPATVKCADCGEAVKAGTYCAKGNCFHVPKGGPQCAECGNTPGMVCEMGLCGYAFCSGVWYCQKCKKPYANRGAGCPVCAKKKS